MSRKRKDRRPMKTLFHEVHHIASYLFPAVMDRIADARVSVARKLDPPDPYVEEMRTQWEAQALADFAKADEARRERDEARARVVELERALDEHKLRIDDLRWWQEQVAEGLGYIERAEGVAGYMVADPDTIVASCKGDRLRIDEALARVAALERELDAERKDVDSRVDAVIGLDTELAAYRSSAEAWAERVVTETDSPLLTLREVYVGGVFVDGWIDEKPAEEKAKAFREALIASLPPCRPLTDAEVERAAMVSTRLDEAAWQCWSQSTRDHWCGAVRIVLAAVGCTFEVKP